MGTADPADRAEARAALAADPEGEALAAEVDPANKR